MAGLVVTMIDRRGGGDESEQTGQVQWPRSAAPLSALVSRCCRRRPESPSETPVSLLRSLIRTVDRARHGGPPRQSVPRGIPATPSHKSSDTNRTEPLYR